MKAEELVTVALGDGVGIRIRRSEAERLGLLNQRMQESANPEPEAKQPEPKRRRKAADKSRKPEGDKAEG